MTRQTWWQISVLWLGLMATDAVGQPPAAEHTRPQLVVIESTRAVAEGIFAGVSGRQLRLPESVSAVTVQVGILAGVDLMDQTARQQLAKESHQQLAEARSEWLASAHKELADWEVANRRTAAIHKDPWGDELRLRIKLLESLPETCSDPGPIFDAVAVRGRNGPLFWIDTDLDGDLGDEIAWVHAPNDAVGRLQVADQPVHFRAVPTQQADRWMVYGTDPEGRALGSLDQPRAPGALADPRSEATEQEEADLQLGLAEQFLTAAQVKEVASGTLQTADQLDPIDGRLRATTADEAARLVWLVLRLHWLDQANRRKDHLPQVLESAQAVVTWVRDHGRPNSERDRRVLLDTHVDALYRQGRALGYMELPDVVARHPIVDPEQHERAFQSVFEELQQLVDTKSPRYCLLHIRQDRRQSRYAMALELLNHHLRHSPPSYWYYQKRRDVYQQLGWDVAYEFEARRLAIVYPR